MSAHSHNPGDKPSSPASAKYEFELPVSAEREEADQAGSITFIGTATVIIRYGGLTLLTDPNFLHKGDHAHLGYGLTSKRLTNPAIELEDLPHVDMVIL